MKFTPAAIVYLSVAAIGLVGTAYFNITGFTSVRRKPRDSAVRVAAELYRQMLAAENSAGTRDAIAAGADVLQNAMNGKSYEQFVLAL